MWLALVSLLAGAAFSSLTAYVLYLRWIAKMNAKYMDYVNRLIFLMLILKFQGVEE